MRAREWTSSFSSELVRSLLAFPDMHNERFRGLLLEDLGERLGLGGPLPVGYHADPRDHTRQIVLSCKKQKSPEAAVAALVATMSELRGDESGTQLLEDCHNDMLGLSDLGALRLHSVLAVVERHPREFSGIFPRDLAAEVAVAGEDIPLRGTEDLAQAIRRLDSPRITAEPEVPLVVRFLGRLAARLTGPAQAELLAEVIAILASDLEFAEDKAQAVLASTSDPVTVERGVLQIRIDQDGSQDQPRYKISGAVFRGGRGHRRLVVRTPAEQTLSDEEVHDAGTRFLERARELGQASAMSGDLTVEFVLPWPLLGCAVERWGADGDYCIGYLFRVIVRSLDRQRNALLTQNWRKRWDRLIDAQDLPTGERMGWLHCGDSAVPEGARADGRVMQVTGDGDITQWLSDEDNTATAVLGLTFAYRPADPVTSRCVKEAVRAGMPVLIWRRDDGDAGELESLLKDVPIRDLPDKIQSWRLASAGPDPVAARAHGNTVLVWDDPYDLEVLPALSAPVSP